MDQLILGSGLLRAPLFPHKVSVLQADAGAGGTNIRFTLFYQELHLESQGAGIPGALCLSSDLSFAHPRCLQAGPGLYSVPLSC